MTADSPTREFPRRVSAEALDSLAENDPQAVHSRRDLVRVNRIMGAKTIAIAGLLRALGNNTPRRVVELGAGDGTLMLRIARTMAPRWPAVELTLLDRQPLVRPPTLAAFQAVGWNARMETADVMTWAAQPDGARADIVFANLFLHHFDDKPLAGIFAAIARRAGAFFACEPRRARLPLWASGLMGCIGANAITRNDAVLSVRAGFRGQELSALWPKDVSDVWRLDEYDAGLFSHCLAASRSSGASHARNV